MPQIHILRSITVQRATGIVEVPAACHSIVSRLVDAAPAADLVSAASKQSIM
jgi:hypothetical protein